jgi:hypothetical protein
MTRFFALVAVLAVSTAANAATLTGSVVKAQTNVVTFDPNTFGPGPNVDVYHVVVENPNAILADSIGLSLTGEFQNFASAPLTFKANTSLPTLGPNTVAETFFVVPNPATILGVNTVDSSTALASNFTSQGGGNFIAAGGSSILAVLSVPTGSPALTGAGWTGNAAVGGVLETISFAPVIPEPTTCVLAGLALAGAAARRRV